jgi:hypothetical protein
MFSWICPKCGHEVPPAYSECPNCSPQGQEAPTTTEAEAAPPPEAEAPPPLKADAAPSSSPPPADLRSLIVPAPEAPPPPPPGRIAVPGWLMSVMFALVFVVIGLTLLLVKQARQPAPAPVVSKAAQIESVQAVSTAQPDPAFKDLELIGFRLTEDDKQKCILQFVAVNHSGADMGELNLKADLMVVSSKDKQPVGTFAFKTALGPYESKDVKTTLDTKMRVYELPDWQFLRAEIAPH